MIFKNIIQIRINHNVDLAHVPKERVETLLKSAVEMITHGLNRIETDRNHCTIDTAARISWDPIDALENKNPSLS